MAQNGLVTQEPSSQTHPPQAALRSSLVVTAGSAGDTAVLHISHWLSSELSPRYALTSAADEYVVSLCLRTTRVELRSGAGSVFDGVMRAGLFHVTGPGKTITAQFAGPCDLLNLHVPTRLLLTRLEGMGAGSESLDGLDSRTLNDPLVEQLVRLLVSEGARGDVIYATAIAQTLLTRLLHLARDAAPVGSLAKWRLRRVEALVESRLAEPLTLSEMAAAAGLSRMHFAAQFRMATGTSPHDYLLSRRIETAKTLLADTDTALAEIALSVGFLAQAHFTTVFKRLVGETPARWRRACRDIDRPLARETDREPRVYLSPFERSRA